MIDAQQLQAELEEHWVLRHHEFCNYSHDDLTTCNCHVQDEAAQRDRILAMLNRALEEQNMPPYADCPEETPFNIIMELESK